MSKGSFEYPEGVHVYRHRVAVDQDGDPLVLIADARTKPVLDRETGHQKVDRITGQPQVALSNLYGFELHQQLRDQPHIWEEITAAPVPEQEKQAPRPSIRKQASAPAEDTAAAE